MRRRLVTFLLPLAIAGNVRAAGPATQPATQPTSQPSTRPTSEPASLFDPARHMKVSEVRPGMKGYGLTVFSGTKIERFEVEAISVLHNSFGFGPQQDVVMIRCLGEPMQHFGLIEGCSGSPIYLYGEDGHARLIGAYAFGFESEKDPIVGVQPIEYMLRLTKSTEAGDDTGTKPLADATTTWSMMDCAPWRASLRDASAVPSVSLRRHDATPSRQTMQPLTVPIALSGASESTVNTLRPMFGSEGFEPLLSRSATSQATTGALPVLEPGSVLGAAVLTGDLEATALGTCTEVIDGRAFGFGHPFNGEGTTSIPMGPGAVNLVMPMLTNSFKLGGLTHITGAIDMDGTSGVAGQIGASAVTVPIEVVVRENADASPRTFHYQAALHRTFTPMMIAAALHASVVAGQQPPVEHTASYRVTMNFAGGRSLTIDNVSTSLEGFELSRDAVWPVSAAMENPFANIAVESITASVDIRRGVDAAMIETATAAQPAYRPGETARVNVRLRKYKGDAFLQSVDIPLPATLKDGDYAITLSDAASRLSEDMATRPELFAMRNVDELFKTMDALAKAGRNDAVYVRLAMPDEGLAIGRTQLPKLPPSRRTLLATAGRPDVAASAQSTVSVVPMPMVISGSAATTIHVKRKIP